MQIIGKTMVNQGGRIRNLELKMGQWQKIDTTLPCYTDLTLLTISGWFYACVICHFYIVKL